MEFIMCEVCGATGIKDKEIVMAEYYEPISKHDKTRFECRDVFGCLDRSWQRIIKVNPVQSQY